MRYSQFINMHILCGIIMYSRSKTKEKKRKTYQFQYKIYRTEIKLVTIIMYYCLLKFAVLSFFLGDRLHKGGGGSN